MLSACTQTGGLAKLLSKDKPRYVFGGTHTQDSNTSVVSQGAWDKSANLTGEHLIVIDVDMQQANYYIGGVQVGYCTVSTGKGGMETPRKTYKVISKDVDHRSSKYGQVIDAEGNIIVKGFVNGRDKLPPGGIYRGASMFNGLQLDYTGIWMHEGYVTSAPESAGCIRLPSHMAKIFYDNTPVGTKVIIK